MQIDKEHWLRICNGDQQAYADMYRFYYKRFYNYGRKFSDDAHLVEDAVQEALMTVWDKRHTIASIDFAATYFYTSFRYLLFQKLKQKQQLVSEAAIVEEPGFSVDQIIIGKETDAAMKAQLQKALSTLTARQREAIFLRFYEGLSYEEVAAVLGISTKATYKIMARALGQLRAQLSISTGLLFLLVGQLFSGR